MRNKNKDKIALVVLTNNPDRYLNDFISSIEMQSLQPQEILIMDSAAQSAKDFPRQKEKYSFLKDKKIKIHTLTQDQFDHGTTRYLATALVNADIYIFQTQDAVLANKNSIANLLRVFADEKIACAYGRQLAKRDADLQAQLVRLFNYPEASYVRSYEDRDIFGIRSCFNSNSFAAYRSKALIGVGGFPKNNIMGEDMFVAAKMLMQGWKVAYQADAQVYHSHNRSAWEEFKYNFDVGVFQQQNPWILHNFRALPRDIWQYLKVEYCYYLQKEAYFYLLKSVLSLWKYLGYLVGRQYKLIPNFLRLQLSLSNFYWKKR